MGILLLLGGIALLFGFFLYPEGFFYGAGLSGMGAVLAPVSMVIFGALLIYGSFRQERELKGEFKKDAFPPPPPSIKQRTCSNCGALLLTGDRFCGNCGKEAK